MGNLLSGSTGGGFKVAFPDGTVRELDGPTSVAELMLEHPQQFVVDVRALSAAAAGKTSKAGAPVMPLPADHILEPGRAYVMLPMARGKAAGFPAEEARRALLATTMARRSLFRRALGVRGAGAEAAGREAKCKAAAEEEAKIGWQEPTTATLTEVSEEKPELLMRQFSSRRWKPSLVTIEEKNLGRKLPHWLF